MNVFAQLATAATEGQLYLESGVAEQCVASCQDFADKLVEIQRQARSMTTVSAYGILGSAQTLGGIFEQKAIGDNGFEQVINQHIETVNQMRDLFEKAGKAYQSADATSAANLSAVDPGH
ncbi:hypothetical protein OG921_09485 [Aldersonia sp. NBC_00410]|uniref:hypothetical protein n=1 Tax=Aldersonia sp. NBC_00410 TaxID=2975954 RepID=UPI00225A6FEB|nr:hypothetical protein [Aldersonia sp. NBC_00410]MCX5043402.1 hypothetical protein [Aldersonia sp. NBC_00410]